MGRKQFSEKDGFGRKVLAIIQPTVYQSHVVVMTKTILLPVSRIGEGSREPFVKHRRVGRKEFAEEDRLPLLGREVRQVLELADVHR